MGWIELPSYFCTLSETGLDMAEKYSETPVGSSKLHKFVKLAEVNKEFAELPKIAFLDDPFNYILEVYMENYNALDIPRRRA